jgi:hypothetical protein
MAGPRLTSRLIHCQEPRAALPRRLAAGRKISVQPETGVDFAATVAEEAKRALGALTAASRGGGACGGASRSSCSVALPPSRPNKDPREARRATRAKRAVVSLYASEPLGEYLAGYSVSAALIRLPLQ